jgi:dinuclear metal center YbgI/SA1388 family protein
MPTVGEVAQVLQPLAPLTLAEPWDNVGLLVGDASWPTDRVMTCLTIAHETVEEAVERGAQLIVSHHPLPFRPIKSITSESTIGQLLLQLIRHSIAVYSAHTAFDSASAGINQHIAIGLGLQEIRPLIPSAGDAEVGTGRFGLAGEPLTLGELGQRTKEFLGARLVRLVGASDKPATRVGIVCGSGGALLDTALAAGCDALITGELTFHNCLEAEARGAGVVLAGHFASERFAMVALADYLADQLAAVEVWSSRSECDPLHTT